MTGNHYLDLCLCFFPMRIVIYPQHSWFVVAASAKRRTTMHPTCCWDLRTAYNGENSALCDAFRVVERSSDLHTRGRANFEATAGYPTKRRNRITKGPPKGFTLHCLKIKDLSVRVWMHVALTQIEQTIEGV